jgi:hypothetical protein
MGFQSSSAKNTQVELKASDLEKITKAIISSLSPLIGSGGKTVYIQGNPGETVKEDYSPETLNKLAKSMIIQQTEKIINFDKLGITKEIQKDKKDIQNTLDLLKGLD